MAYNRGKKFENWLKKSFKATMPDPSIDRLNDTIYTSNISDFIGYSYPNIYYLECKSKKGNTFPFSNLSQYGKLCRKVNIKGVRAGVVIWFIDHDRVVYVPIATVTKMMQDDKKSVNITKSIEEGYRIIEIPTVVKRVYPDCDCSCLLDLNDGD